MTKKISSIFSPLSLIIPPDEITVSSSTTENPQSHHAMPQSMGMVGRLMMGIAEMVLPEMAMKMVAQFMHDTNGLVYSGTGFTGKISFPQDIINYYQINNYIIEKT